MGRRTPEKKGEMKLKLLPPHVIIILIKLAAIIINI
jgi:hypothetical protein